LSKKELRIILLHELKLGRNAAEANQNVMEAYGEKGTTIHWFKKLTFWQFKP